MVCEIVGGEPYEYYPLGEYIVSAPGVCDGEPTFKYTRINVEHALDLLSGGWTIDQVADAYKVPQAAVREVIQLAKQALISQTG
jgi:uncharacterized protein (DUF433 family)